MRVALINTPSLDAQPVSRSMAGGLGFDGGPAMVLMPLDLATLAATLRATGESIALIDADPLGLDAAATYARLGTETWDVLIATVSLPSLERDAEFLRGLRARHPGARLFAKTLVRDPAILESLLAASGADLVLHGEVDLTIGDIAHGRDRGGCAWLEPGPDGAAPVLRSDPGQPVADVDRLPIAARDLLPIDRYTYPLLGSPVATLQTSRGCPYPCGFYCPYPLVEGVKWRAQSPERIVAELRQVVEELGIRRIYFRDATFTLSEERVADLCARIVAAGWDLEWACETRIDCLSDDLLERMRSAGCTHILVGIETGDEDTMRLREGKRGLTLSQLERVRATTRRLGIRLHFLLIAGLPADTRESIVDTYDLIVRTAPDSIGVTTITPYPGTPLHAQALREGWIDADDWRAFGGHQVPMHTPNLSREDLALAKQILEEGFEIQRRLRAGGDAATRDLAERHYRAVLQWAHGLGEPIAALQRAARALPLARPQPSVATAPPPLAQHALVAAPVATRDGAPLLSVVLPTRDRADILRKTLLAYASQTVDAGLFEVIVVDDGSSDRTVEMLERWRGGGVRLLRQEHRGPNAARNRGLAAARGAIVLVTGDDIIPGPSLVEHHLRFHRENPDDLDALLGFIDWSPEIPVTPFMSFITSPAGGHQFAFHEIQGELAPHTMFYASNVSLKRALLERQTVLFDEDFTEAAYDDSELGYRLSRQGMRLHHAPQAIAYHHHPTDVASFSRRQRSAGRMAIVMGRKHPELASALRIPEAERLGAALGPAAADGALNAALEAERPDRAAFAALRMGESESFADYYVRTVLHPLYRHALDLAYLVGIREALDAPPRLAAGPPAPAATTGFRGAAASARFDASIVIPLFNMAELTRQCLQHLAEVTREATFEVILVDNGSTDHTAEVLASLGGDVRVIRNRENLGFARACNQGAEIATGRHLVFLNNDTVPLPGWLGALVEEADAHPRVAAVGAKLLYADGTIQHAGVAFSRAMAMPYHVYRGCAQDAAWVDYRREMQVVTGACMLVRPEVFRALGGFHEGYRNGFEDVDLCLQIRQQGRDVVYQPRSVLYHLESQTPGRKDHDAENARRLRARWGAQWWLCDEDTFYVRDGFCLRSQVRDGDVTLSLEPLGDPAERARWETVCAAAEAALARDLTTLHGLLAAPARWPIDAVVLLWAHGLCAKSGAPQLAEPFATLLRDGALAPAHRPLAQIAT